MMEYSNNKLLFHSALTLSMTKIKKTNQIMMRANLNNFKGLIEWHPRKYCRKFRVPIPTNKLFFHKDKIILHRAVWWIKTHSNQQEATIWVKLFNKTMDLAQKNNKLALLSSATSTKKQQLIQMASLHKEQLKPQKKLDLHQKEDIAL